MVDIPFAERLTAKKLAAKIGPRYAGRPTGTSSVWRWMNGGCRGVRLKYQDEIGVRLTCWRWYQEFRAEVAAARERERLRRRKKSDSGT